MTTLTITYLLLAVIFLCLAVVVRSIQIARGIGVSTSDRLLMWKYISLALAVCIAGLVVTLAV